MSFSVFTVVRLILFCFQSNVTFFFTTLFKGLSLFASKLTNISCNSGFWSPISSFLSPLLFVVSSSKISNSNWLTLPANDTSFALS